MGEMADYALDEVMDFEDDRLSFRTGCMTLEGAYSRGIVNELGGEIGTEGCITKICRCCGESGLQWGVHSGKWRLFNGSNLHVCPKNPLND